MTGHADGVGPTGLDDLLARLRAIDDRLSAEPGYDETIELLEERRDLRATAAKLRLDSRTADQIAAELEHATSMRDRILDRHLSVGHVGGGNGPGGGGIEPRDVFAVNEAIDRAYGLAELEERIQALRTELRGSTS